MPGFPVLHFLSEYAQIHVHWVGDATSSSHALPPPSPLLLPLIFPSIRVFSSESALCIRWLKYWSFRFSIKPSNEYSELISFRMDWFVLLALKGLSRVFSSTTIQIWLGWVTSVSPNEILARENGITHSHGMAGLGQSWFIIWGPPSLSNWILNRWISFIKEIGPHVIGSHSCWLGLGQTLLISYRSPFLTAITKVGIGDKACVLLALDNVT